MHVIHMSYDMTTFIVVQEMKPFMCSEQNVSFLVSTVEIILASAISLLMIYWAQQYVANYSAHLFDLQLHNICLSIPTHTILSRNYSRSNQHQHYQSSTTIRSSENRFVFGNRHLIITEGTWSSRGARGRARERECRKTYMR
jgi:hypothetical protein